MSFHPTHIAATGAITGLIAHLLVFGLGGRATRSMVAGAVLGSLISFFCIWGLLWLISRRRHSSSFWWVTLLDHWCQLRLLNTTASTFGVAALVLVQWWPELLPLCVLGLAFFLLARVAVAWLIRDPDGVRATPQTATPPAVLQAGGDAASDVGTGRRSLAGAREPEAKSAWISRFRLRHYPTTASALLTLVAPFFINARFLEREFLPAGYGRPAVWVLLAVTVLAAILWSALRSTRHPHTILFRPSGLEELWSRHWWSKADRPRSCDLRSRPLDIDTNAMVVTIAGSTGEERGCRYDLKMIDRPVEFVHQLLTATADGREAAWEPPPARA